MAQPVQKGARGEDDRRRVEFYPLRIVVSTCLQTRYYPRTHTIPHNQRFHRTFDQGQVRLALECAQHFGGIEGFIGVGAEGAHRGSLACAHMADMREGAVDVDAHLTAERVDLAHEVPLGRSPNGAVAGHVGGALDVERDYCDATAHARHC